MSNNKFLSYTSRDYESIRDDLIAAIPSLTDIWTSRDQADPGMVLVTLMAALGDNLSFNMDTQSLEFFGRTVTQRKNAQAIFDLIGYKMHWYQSAKLSVTITNQSRTETLAIPFGISSGNNAKLSSSISSAPPYILIDSDAMTSNKWDSSYPKFIQPNSTMTFNAIQGVINSVSFSSSDIDDRNRYYLRYSKLDQDHIWLKSGSFSTSNPGTQLYWRLVNNINELADTIPAFEFNVDEYNLPYIEFVPYWRTRYISEGTDVKFTLYYIATAGSAGDVTANILNTVPNARSLGGEPMYNSEIIVSHQTNAYSTNNLDNVPGKDPETARDAYIATKKIIGTYNTLVTVIDFERFFSRLGNISNALCIDGQRAIDLNKEVSDYFNKITFNSGIPVSRLPETSESNKVYSLVNDQLDDDNKVIYEAGSYINRIGSWITQSVILLTDVHDLPSNPDINSKYAVISIDTSLNYAHGKTYIYSNKNWIDLGDIEVVTSLPVEPTDVYYMYPRSNGYKKYTNKLFYSDVNFWERLEDVDTFGFKPYSAEMHLVCSNFAEKDPLDSRIEIAKSYPVIVETIDNKNYGYMNYIPSNSIIGLDPSSEVNQSGVNDYKLISSDLHYGYTRKFPFFIDGKIHLREPTTPQNANLILRNVYNAIFATFVAGNLTFGEKIRFSDMINTINMSDINIGYFDAGNNNSHGSLFIYPNENNLNPYDIELTDSESILKPYGINIDPKYFNPISLQHYEDILFQNNPYIYWCETASGHLSISEDSIAYKLSPSISNIMPNAKLLYSSANIVNGFTLSGMLLLEGSAMTQSLQHVKNNYMQYALIKSITTASGPLEHDPFSSILQEPIYKKVDDIIWRSVNLDITGLVTEGDTKDTTEWKYLNPDFDSSIPESESNPKYIINTDYFVFAYKMIETLSTNETEPKFGCIKIIQPETSEG